MEFKIGDIVKLSRKKGRLDFGVVYKIFPYEFEVEIHICEIVYNYRTDAQPFKVVWKGRALHINEIYNPLKFRSEIMTYKGEESMGFVSLQRKRISLLFDEKIEKLHTDSSLMKGLWHNFDKCKICSGALKPMVVEKEVKYL